MEIVILIVGLFMVGLGFLVKSSPHLMAGYNTMSKDKQKNVDVEGLSTLMRNGLIAIGLATIAGYYLFKWLGLTAIANSMIAIVTLIGVVILVIKAQRFDHNEEKGKHTKAVYFTLGLVVVLVVGLISYGLLPAKVSYDEDAIRFSGMYGLAVNVSDLEQVDLSERIPRIKMRTNGFGLGAVKKGTFKLDELGKSRLLIHTDQPPYLMLLKKNGDHIIVNFKDERETEEVYDRIKKMME